jgi:hypothetical protein
MKTNYSIIKTVVALFITGGAFSCSNDLDEKVFSSVTQQSYSYTEKDFNPVVSSAYPPLKGFCDQWGFWTAQEASADAIVMPPTATGWYDGGVYVSFHYHTWYSELSLIRSSWNWMYQGILIANNAIDLIERDIVPASSPAVKEQGLAELRAARAFYYWLICDNWGDAPLVADMSTELPAKTPRQEIYNFIVNELLEIIPKLSEEQGASMYGRINKWAGKAILANVYLNAEVYTGQAHWNECIGQCDDIINSGKCELSPNFKDPFRAYGVETSKEVLFTIPYDKTLVTGQRFHLVSWNGIMQKKFDLETSGWGSGTSMGITQFVETYEVEDSRIDDTWLRGPQLDMNGEMLVGVYDNAGEPFIIVKDIPDAKYVKELEGYRMNKYEVAPRTPTDSDTDYPLLRYAQVLMMKAECLLRTNQPGAGALVTQVRQRAFKDNPSKAVVTDEQLKGNSAYKYGYVENYVIVDPGNQDPVQFGRMYDELGWEFAWEAYRRRDMIRFGLFTKKSWLSHKPQGDHRTVFPIPEQALTANPKLVQNPNYTK